MKQRKETSLVGRILEIDINTLKIILQVHVFFPMLSDKKLCDLGLLSCCYRLVTAIVYISPSQNSAITTINKNKQKKRFSFTVASSNTTLMVEGGTKINVQSLLLFSYLSELWEEWWSFIARLIFNPFILDQEKDIRIFCYSAGGTRRSSYSKGDSKWQQHKQCKKCWYCKKKKPT